MSQDTELYDTVGPSEPNTRGGITRRDALRLGALTAGTAVAGPATLDQVAPRYSPVGRAEAIGPLVGVVIGAAAGAAVAWATTRYLDRGEDETQTQTHRNIQSTARAMDSSSDAEEEFENLVAERAENWIWQDAALEFTEGFNDVSESQPTLGELKDQMEETILSKYSDLEQQIVDNQTLEVLQLLEMFHHIDAYGHGDAIGDMLGYYHRYNIGSGSAGWAWDLVGPSSDDLSDASEDYGLTGSEDLVRPYSDYYAEKLGEQNLGPSGRQLYDEDGKIERGKVNEVDDLIYTDYELIDGSTMPAAIGWGSATFYDGDEFGNWRYYDDADGITDISLATSTYTGGAPQYFGVSDPEDSDTWYEFLHVNRRGSAISEIRNVATSLTTDVDSWVDQIAEIYSRGELPLADAVSNSRLWEEFDYKEGEASMTALAASQLGYETDIAGTMTVRDYGRDVEYDAETETWVNSSGEEADLDAAGEEMSGYPIVDYSDSTQEPPQLEAGEVYDASNLDADGSGNASIGISRPSGATTQLTGAFRVEAIRSYENGEAVEKDTFTPQNYVFSPRDPNQYEEDVQQANNAREDATENPEFNFDDLFGGGGLPGMGDIPRWLLGVPVVGVVLWAFVEIQGDK